MSPAIPPLVSPPAPPNAVTLRDALPLVANPYPSIHLHTIETIEVLLKENHEVRLGTPLEDAAGAAWADWKTFQRELDHFLHQVLALVLLPQDLQQALQAAVAAGLVLYNARLDQIAERLDHIVERLDESGGAVEDLRTELRRQRVRTINRSALPNGPFSPLPNERGQLPHPPIPGAHINAPPFSTRAEVDALRGQDIDAYLGLYGLPTNGNVAPGRQRLMQYITSEAP
ncbi:hypothetical protein JCM10450v2_001287 [Rhodotorula kratochvilovae]